MVRLGVNNASTNAALRSEVTGDCRFNTAGREHLTLDRRFSGAVQAPRHSKNAGRSYGLPACPIRDYRADQQTQLGITNLFAEELSDAPSWL